MKAILVDTIKKEYRSKLLFILFGLTILIVFLTNSILGFLVNSFFEGVNDQQIEKIVGYSLIIFYYITNSWSVCLATLIGVNVLKSDFNSQVINQLLSFSIERSDYLIVRVVGAWLIVMGYYVLSLTMAMTLLSVTYRANFFDLFIFVGLFHTSLTVLGILLISACLSLYFSRLVAFLLTIVLSSLIALSATIGPSLFYDFPESLGFLSIMMFLIYWIFPRFHQLSQYSTQIINADEGTLGELLSSLDYIWTLSHFFLTLFAFFLLAVWTFKRKDL